MIEGRELELQAWEPRESLAEVSAEVARYSRGFLLASSRDFFRGLSELWMPLFQSLSLDISVVSFETSFVVPDEISRSVRFSVLDEDAHILYVDGSENVVAESISPGVIGSAKAMVLEYIERRLLSTIAMAWSGSEAISCSYKGISSPAELSGSGVARLVLDCGGQPIELRFLFGPNNVDAIDSFVRRGAIDRWRAEHHESLSDAVHQVSIELAELAVPPALLIDYMRAGTVVDLEVLVSTSVSIRVDEVLWAEGVLCRYGEDFAVEITSLSPAPRAESEGTTRVRVQVASTEMDETDLIEHWRVGAILVTDSTVQSNASLIISGENVATALVAAVDGNFVLHILPK